MWFLIAAGVGVLFLWSAVTAPSRAAKSLKEIERELKRRGGS